MLASCIERLSDRLEMFSYGVQFVNLDSSHHTLLQNMTYEALIADRQKVVGSPGLNDKIPAGVAASRDFGKGGAGCRITLHYVAAPVQTLAGPTSFWTTVVAQVHLPSVALRLRVMVLPLT